MKLFRVEAIEALSPKLEGDVIVRQSRIQEILIYLSLLAFAAIILVSIFGTYSKKISAKGYVSTNKGVVQVYPSRNGVVSNIHVSEGDKIEAGEAIATINYEVNTIENTLADKMYLESTLNSISLIRNQIDLNHKVHETKLEQVRKNILSTETRLDLLKNKQNDFLNKYNREKERLESHRKLFLENYISQETYNVQIQKYDAAYERFDAVNFEILSTNSELDQFRSSLKNMPIEHRLLTSRLKEQINSLVLRKIEIEYKLNDSIVAPVSGFVTSIQYSTGQNLHLNMPITTIIPGDSEYVIELLLSSNYLGRINIGSKVFIKYNAFPYQLYGLHEGTVIETSKYIVNAPSEPRNSFTQNRSNFRVRVELEEELIKNERATIPLTPGMTVTAEIVQEERPLWAWIFANIKGIF